MDVVFTGTLCSVTKKDMCKNTPKNFCVLFWCINQTGHEHNRIGKQKTTGAPGSPELMNVSCITLGTNVNTWNGLGESLTSIHLKFSMCMHIELTVRPRLLECLRKTTSSCKFRFDRV